jgi:hypothetical protein
VDPVIAALDGFGTFLEVVAGSLIAFPIFYTTANYLHRRKIDDRSE